MQVATGPTVGMEAVPVKETVLLFPFDKGQEATLRGKLLVLFRDTVETFKLRITAMVVLTSWAGFRLGAMQSGTRPFSLALLEALFGIGLVTCGASVLNEVIERHSDAKMLRTANRPLAAGRMGVLYGALLGVSCIACGSLWLVILANFLTGILTLLTAITYVALYTPLKRLTPLATFVGAFPGAMPPLLGWTAMRGKVEWPALALFAILFTWQIPHFMAIAWLYREDYRRARIRMLPVVHPDGRSTAQVALADLLLLLPISLLPYFLHVAGPWYFVAAIFLGLFYLLYTVRFFRAMHTPEAGASRNFARALLKASVVYLPLLLAALMLNATS
ncbi:MAG: heme o synthase [Acidobacteriaceae bacterium]